RRGLTRPELAVLLAYAKMSLDEALLASDPPDLPELAGDLRHYFPPALRERFARQIATHPLHREITATVVTNDLINRAGITFIHDMRARTGRAPPEIARAYRIVREVFELASAWANIEALDNRVAAGVQSEMLLDIAGLVEHATAWLLRNERLAPAIAGAPLLTAALEIADLAERAAQPLERAARTYYATGAHFALGEMRT